MRDGVIGRLPDSIMLSAGDRFRQAISIDPANAGHWATLGMSCWNMIADLAAAAPGPREPWDPARSMFPAQATFCFRRALELDPSDSNEVSSLLRTLEAREMSDAQNLRFPSVQKIAEASLIGPLAITAPQHCYTWAGPRLPGESGNALSTRRQPPFG